eukprot:3506056-Rhodomonas_salina.1
MSSTEPEDMVCYQAEAERKVRVQICAILSEHAAISGTVCRENAAFNGDSDLIHDTVSSRNAAV